MFSPQIHIVFNCEEEDRITKPVIDHAPNKLYYFIANIKKTGQKDINLSFYEKNAKFLKERIPSLEIIKTEVDYTDYTEIIQEISKIIKIEREINHNCRIYINVSTGSKMTALASVEASKLWNCEIYYVYATLYDPRSGGPRHKGEMIIQTPITFPIKKPEQKFINALKIIEKLLDIKYKNKKGLSAEDKFVYKKELVRTLQIEGVLNIQKKNTDERKLKSSEYTVVNSKFLNPLANVLKYIKISDDKRNKKIYLTEAGKGICDIFKYLG